MSTCSEGYTTRLQLSHWAERSGIYVHFHTTESLGGDNLGIRHPCHTLELGRCDAVKLPKVLLSSGKIN